MMDHATATLDDIRRVGLDALARALGPVGMTRFLQQFETGRGDYTAERQRRTAPARPGEVRMLAEELRREQHEGHFEQPGAAPSEP